jgi:hypothetical protein
MVLAGLNPANLPGQQTTTIFTCPVGRIFFSKHSSKDEPLLARLPARHHKEAKMTDVKVPQRLEPQDVLKWLVALRRALQAKVA